MKSLVAGMPATDQDAPYRLLAAGILRQVPDGSDVTFRCRLYEDYLKGHMA